MNSSVLVFSVQYSCVPVLSTEWLHNSQLCGFVSQLIEHVTGRAEVIGSNPVEATRIFQMTIKRQLLNLSR